MATYGRPTEERGFGAGLEQVERGRSGRVGRAVRESAAVRAEGSTVDRVRDLLGESCRVRDQVGESESWLVASGPEGNAAVGEETTAARRVDVASGERMQRIDDVQDRQAGFGPAGERQDEWVSRCRLPQAGNANRSPSCGRSRSGRRRPCPSRGGDCRGRGRSLRGGRGRLLATCGQEQGDKQDRGTGTHLGFKRAPSSDGYRGPVTAPCDA